MNGKDIVILGIGAAGLLMLAKGAAAEEAPAGEGSVGGTDEPLTANDLIDAYNSGMIQGYTVAGGQVKQPEQPSPTPEPLAPVTQPETVPSGGSSGGGPD